MGLAAVLTTEIALEPPDRLAEVHAFISHGAAADAAHLKAMKRHASAVTLRRANAGGSDILAAVLIVEPVAQGRSLIADAFIQPSFFLIGEVHVSSELEAFRSEVQRDLIAAAVTWVETVLGNREDRDPCAIVLVQSEDLAGSQLLNRLSARRLGPVGQLVTMLQRELGLSPSAASMGWVIRSESLRPAALATLACGAEAGLERPRLNRGTRRMQVLSVRNALPWSGALRPLVEEIAAQGGRAWGAPPADVVSEYDRAADDRRG